MGPGLAPGGAPLVVGLGAASLLLLLAAILLARWPAWLGALTVMALAVAAGFLFRDPRRVGPADPAAVLAPADGRIVAIDSVASPAYLGAPTLRVSIRSGLLDVHVVRAPVDGVVDYLTDVEERTLLGISTGRIRVLLRHVPEGALVHVREGQLVDRGERTGLLPTGGLLDLLLPLELGLQVDVGDRVRSGATVLAMTAGVP